MAADPLGGAAGVLEAQGLFGEGGGTLFDLERASVAVAAGDDGSELALQSLGVAHADSAGCGRLRTRSSAWLPRPSHRCGILTVAI